jgi:hypothetical protein
MPRYIYRNSEGVILPGVTTVIDNLGWNRRALMHWAWKMGWDQRDYREEKKAAANIGTVAHKLIEIDVTQGIVIKDDLDMLKVQYGPEIVEQAQVAFESWMRWRDSHEFVSVSAEESLVSESLQTGGTLDHRMVMAIAHIQGRMSILDVKVTSGLYLEHIIQVATYAFMRNENFPDEPVVELHWLKLGKGEPSFAHEWMPYDCDKVKYAIEVFRHLRAIHDLKKRMK